MEWTPSTPAEMDADDETQSNRNKSHLPPYLLDFRDESIPPYARDIYSSLGMCICYHHDILCDATRVTNNKYLPWTRFPVRNGHEIGRFAFTTWQNPLVCRSPVDVRKAINTQCAITPSEDGLTYSTNTDKKRAWFPFWMAVDKLYAFIAQNSHLDAPTIVQYAADLRYRLPQYKKHRKSYQDKNLLGEESDEHRKLFNEYYDHLIQTLERNRNVLQPQSKVNDVIYQYKHKKEEAVQLLLQQRNMTAVLFAKADYLIAHALFQQTKRKPPAKRKVGAGGSTQTAAQHKRSTPVAVVPPYEEAQTDMELATADDEAQNDMQLATLFLYMHGHPEVSVSQAQADIENLIDGAERPSPMDIRNLIHGPESPFSQPRAALLNSLLDRMRELSVDQCEN